MMPVLTLEQLTQPWHSVRSLWTGELLIGYTTDRGRAAGFKSDCDRQGIATELVTIDGPATSLQERK